MSSFSFARNSALVLLSSSTALVSPASAEPETLAARQEVFVTATPLFRDPDRFAQIVERVDRNEILRKGGASLADSLSDIPGVTGSGFAAGASRPVIRGFDANRVRILENGIGSFDVSEVGPDHGIPIDPLSAEAIEVVRGAATLRYGSQAIGGVVNAINNRVPLRLPDEPLTGDVAGSYGLNGDARQGSALIDARLGNLALHADGFARNANSYRTPDGPLANSFNQSNGYSAGGSTVFGDGRTSRIGGAYVHYNAKYGIPNEESLIDMHQDKALFGSSFRLDVGALETLTVDAGYANYTHTEFVPDLGAASTFNDEEWDARAELLFGGFGPFSAGALGAQVQNRKFSAGGEGGEYLFPTLTKTHAVFGFTESKLAERLALQFGLRIESVNVEGTPASDVFTRRNFTPLSGSIGLLYDVTDALTLGLTAASAARAPSQTELFARGPHESTQTFETGNPAFELERAHSLEGSVRYEKDNLRIEGSLWGAFFKSYIAGELTGGTCDEDGNCLPDDSLELKELIYAQRDARFWGVEAKAAIGLLKAKTGGALAAEVLADYVRATFDGGGNVPRVPPYHLSGGLGWTSRIADAGVLLTYAGRQDETGFAETPTKGFFSLNSAVTVRPLKEKPALALSIVGRNLTDSVQRNHVAINKDEVILPGRDVRLVISMAF